MKKVVEKKKKQKLYKNYFLNANFSSAVKFHERCLHLLFGKFFYSNLILSFSYVISACGGNVSWDKTMCAGATYDVSDESITHQIIDRPKLNDIVINRVYVQPQWIFDSINARKLLPVDNYLPGYFH